MSTKLSSNLERRIAALIRGQAVFEIPGEGGSPPRILTLAEYAAEAGDRVAAARLRVLVTQGEA